jgi:hypothetical protein
MHTKVDYIKRNSSILNTDECEKLAKYFLGCVGTHASARVLFEHFNDRLENVEGKIQGLLDREQESFT